MKKPSLKMKILNPTFFLLLLSLSLALALLTYKRDNFTVQSFLATCNTSSDITIKQSLKKSDFRLLIGVFSMAERYERRQLIRNSYWDQANDYSNLELDIRFVLCNLSREEDMVLVALEIKRYDDIIILDCVENGYKGKTYTYFSSLPMMFNDRPYDYAMKCDDDTYLRLGNLMESLRSKPRDDVYYGMLVPCEKTEDEIDFLTTTFMSGMGYVISWDLVRWIASNDMIKDLKEGPEDVLVGVWLNKGNKGRNRFHNRNLMYDYKGEANDLCFRHDFIPETIAVHQLKDNFNWARTLEYFNATKGIEVF